MFLLREGDVVCPLSYEPLTYQDWREYQLENPKKRDLIMGVISNFERLMIPVGSEESCREIDGKCVYAHDFLGGYCFDYVDENILYIIKNSELDQKLRFELLKFSKRLPRFNLP